MMKSEQTMTVRALTCPRDNALFTVQEAARLCVHCHEPFLPRNCKIYRCTKCGTQGKNGKFACECASGPLQVSGYRCPGCQSEGGDEMLAGPIACPYCFHVVEAPKPAASKAPAPTPAALKPPPSNPLFRFRRWSEIAAVCLVAAIAAAVAYRYGSPLIHRWLEPSKSSSPNPHPGDEPPGTQKPSPGHAAVPQGPVPGQEPGQGVVTEEPPNGGEPPPQLRPAIIASFSTSAQTIQRGSSVTLRWEVIGDNPTVSLLPGIGSVPATGTWQVSPEATQQYTLTAINTGESEPQTKSLLVVVVPSAAYPGYPPAPNQTPSSSEGRDPRAMGLLAAVQNAMGGKRNLEALRGWQRTERVTWEINRGSTFETTTFIAPSDIRIQSFGNNTTVEISNGVAGWTWSSTSPVRSPLPAQTASVLPFRELPPLVLSDDDPARTITLAGPSTLLVTDRRNDRVYLRLDPGTHLPQAITWMNLDGSELEETYSNWRQSAGVLWWTEMVRSRNHQEFSRADVTGLHVN